MHNQTCLHYLFYSPSLGYAISCSSCLPRPFHHCSIMLIFPHIRSSITSGGLWKQLFSCYTAEPTRNLNDVIRELLLLVRIGIRFPARTKLFTATTPRPSLGYTCPA